jgi:hypothetical protein
LLPHTCSLDDDGDHLAGSERVGLVVEYSEEVPEELGVGSDRDIYLVSYVELRMKRRRTGLTSPILTEHPIESSPSSGLHPEFGFSIIVFPKFVILDEIFLDDEFGESLHDLSLSHQLLLPYTERRNVP